MITETVMDQSACFLRWADKWESLCDVIGPNKTPFRHRTNQMALRKWAGQWDSLYDVSGPIKSPLSPRTIQIAQIRRAHQWDRYPKMSTGSVHCTVQYVRGNNVYSQSNRKEDDIIGPRGGQNNKDDATTDSGLTCP